LNKRKQTQHSDAHQPFENRKSNKSKKETNSNDEADFVVVVGALCERTYKPQCGPLLQACDPPVDGEQREQERDSKFLIFEEER
jgi:hypothetical protein